jgi:SAM-dependent methyltransferase
MRRESFSQLEREGWQRNAADYDTVDLPATCQSFAPLLDSAGDLRGRRVLEVASGTGHLAEAAIARGSIVVGIDVAANMVALARRRVPGAIFHEGNAEALPFEDAQFDFVFCCFGLLHFAQPAQALREMARVLRPGGSVRFTVWCAPEQGNEFMGLLYKAYQSHANLEVDLPPAPPIFALADPGVRDPMLEAAGFEAITAQRIPIVWPIHGPETPIDFVLRGAVRWRMIYDRQTPGVQERIREALAAATVPFLGAGGIPAAAVLVTAAKA